MQIVINISEKMYESVMDGTYCGTLYQELKNGTILPKGHGRLVDADEIDNNIYDLTRSMDLNYGQISEVVDTAPTIVKADRSEES